VREGCSCSETRYPLLYHRSVSLQRASYPPLPFPLVAAIPERACVWPFLSPTYVRRLNDGRRALLDHLGTTLGGFRRTFPPRRRVFQADSRIPPPTRQHRDLSDLRRSSRRTPARGADGRRRASAPPAGARIGRCRRGGRARPRRPPTNDIVRFYLDTLISRCTSVLYPAFPLPRAPGMY